MRGTTIAAAVRDDDEDDERLDERLQFHATGYRTRPCSHFGPPRSELCIPAPSTPNSARRAHTVQVKVEVLVIEGCAGAALAFSRLEAARVDLGVKVEVVVRTMVDGHVLDGFAGSPTFLVDGVDLFPGGVPTRSLACRLYEAGDGHSAAPDSRQLAERIRARG